MVIQNPNYLGLVEQVDALGQVARDKGVTVVAAVNPVSLSVLKAPAEYGAELAVGEAQPFGIYPGAGGPLLGFFAVMFAVSVGAKELGLNSLIICMAFTSRLGFSMTRRASFM